jgi:hypothetical protein
MFTIIVAPIILLLYWSTVIEKDQAAKAVGAILFYMIYAGCAFSLIALWLFGLLYKDLSNHSITNMTRKLILCFVGMLLIFITFFFLNPSFASWDADFFQFPLAYSLALILGISVFRLPKFDRIVK